MERTARGLLAPALLVLIFSAPVLAQDETFTIPAGTTLDVRLTTTLSTQATQNGDPWTGIVLEPIFAKGREIVPANSTVEGRVTYLKEPGRAKGVGEMRLVAETITTTDGTHWSIVAGLEDAKGAEGAKVTGQEGTVKGPGKSAKDAAVKAGVGAGAGAAVGGIAGGGTGALYGMGIGAAAGLIHSVFKRHKDLLLPQGTELTFVISRDTTAKKVTKAEASASK
jgi:hypothetical protein